MKNCRILVYHFQLSTLCDGKVDCIVFTYKAVNYRIIFIKKNSEILLKRAIAMIGEKAYALKTDTSKRRKSISKLFFGHLI
jgi:hypothetical protein